MDDGGERNRARCFLNRAIETQADDAVLAGAEFMRVEQFGSGDEAMRRYLARLLANADRVTHAIQNRYSNIPPVPPLFAMYG